MIRKFASSKYFQIQIAVGYALIALLMACIVFTWIYEWQNVAQQEEEYRRINTLRQDVNNAHMHFLELSLLGETVLEWDSSDVELYHSKRLVLDSLLCDFKSIYPAERIDSVRLLMENKQAHLIQIMDLLNRQENINEQIAQRVPVIAAQSTKEPSKKKRSGFLGIFGKKVDSQPTTSSMLYTLNRDMIAKQQNQQRQLTEYADSLAQRNMLLNSQLQELIGRIDRKVNEDLQEREAAFIAMQERSFLHIGTLTFIMCALLIGLYLIIHRNINRINQYRVKTSILIEKLQNAVKQNRMLLTSRKKMLLTITHDLRTLLTSINGYAELATIEDNSEKAKGYSKNILQLSGSMTDMLNTLLNFFRLDSGKEQIHNEPFHIHSIAKLLKTEFEAQAEAKDLAFEVKICNDVVLMGDKERLLQIGNNLLSNAIKFTDKGFIYVSLAHNNDSFTISVQDTGSGMDEDDKKRIFEAFERLPNAATQDGFGLGLSIVKNIVEMMGGQIEVASEKGKGSCFTVDIPMKLANETEEKSWGEVRTENGNIGCKVLVLDDDNIILSMTRDMLQYKQIHCDICNNVGDMMEAIRTRDYDLLITDLRMPEMNGYDVLKLLRSSNVGNSQEIPVVISTALGSCDEASLLRHGFVGCLFKPFSLDELANTVEKYAQKASDTFMPDFSTLLAYGNKSEMLETLIVETRKVLLHIEDTIAQSDYKELDELVHHLRPSWAVIRADKPLENLHEVLHTTSASSDANIKAATISVLSAGNIIMAQAEKEMEAYDEDSCN